MESINIIPSDNKLWQQVWMLYNESFPDHERRRINAHTKASDDPAYHSEIVVENGSLLALLFYWEYEDKLYVEHFAVNPAMRGKNVGSRIMREFIEDNKGRTIVLEIEPPEDDTTRRRLAFYERLGFRDTGFIYMHPSYSKKDGVPHRLQVLSYPEAISEQELDRFREFMFNRVITYWD